MHRKQVFILLILIASIAGMACGSRFVKKDEVVKFSKDYEKVFVLKERIDIGNFESLNKGAKMRIYFKATGEYVSVYAYPYSQPREEAQGKCILQLFETDFPNKKFSEQVLRDRIGLLLEEHKGKLDAAAGSSFAGADLQRTTPLPPQKGGGGGGRGGAGRGRRGR
jgi:type II secretion system-associated lipoprotein